MKILIAEDDPLTLEALSELLRLEGFEVIAVQNGSEALARWKEDQPDLVCLDIMMPEMDGVEVCRQLRSDKVFDQTIISFLTARDEDYSQIAALDVGGDDYITKPIRPRLLISRVKALFRRTERGTEEQKSEVIKVGDLSIDKEKVLVFRGEEQIEMAKK